MCPLYRYVCFIVIKESRPILSGCSVGSVTLSQRVQPGWERSSKDFKFCPVFVMAQSARDDAPWYFLPDSK